ncbi:unnamed protein product [Cuscuta campestris]|uniref:Ubiquitin-like protease family profile domain-containing protein n=1 Tax=Cuscuta campestris TaxID=132261 RepID=A0A484LAK4_9ASTE|nr:unnamed protein product [Cuscuta campestris]
MSLLIPVSAHFGAQYSACSDICEAINNIEKNLSPDQLEQFRKTPIGHFMGLKNLQFSGQIIHQMLLLLVEDQPHDEFWILRNGEIVKFTFNDWCRITGLPNTNRYPALKDKELGQSSLCHTFLGGGVTKCTFKHVREKYVAAENNMDSKKMVDFSMLYFIESVLLAKDRSTCIQSTHLHLVEEPKKFKSYPWAWESYLLTIRHMKGAMDGQPEKFEKKSKETPNYKSLKYTFYGFPLPIQEPQDNMTTTLNSQEALPIPSDTHMFEVDSHMVEVDDKEGDDLDEDKLLMELTLNKEKLLDKGKHVINEPLQKRKRQKSKYYCSPFTDPRPHNVSPTTIELQSKGVGHVTRDFFRDLIDQEKWLSNDHLEAIMDNMMEVLNGIERKNYIVVGPVFVIFLPVNGDGRYWLLAEIDLLRNQVRVYDSLKGPKSSFYVKEVVRRIPPLLRTVKGVGANTLEKEWETFVVNDIPQQDSRYGNCGVMVLAYLEYLLVGLPLSRDCSSEHMLDFRCQFAARLWRGRKTTNI